MTEIKRATAKRGTNNGAPAEEPQAPAEEPQAELEQTENAEQPEAGDQPQRGAVLDALDEPDEEALEAEEQETPDEADLLQAGTIKSSLLVEEDSETADSIRLYLREIGRVPLLTAQDEVTLAQQYERGEDARRLLAARCIYGSEKVEPWFTKFLAGAGSAPLFGKPRCTEAELEAINAELNENTEPLVRQFFDGAPLSALFPRAGFRREQFQTMEDALQHGVAAKARLIEANLRLVVSIAKRYAGRGMLFLDLIQEGNLGLIRAVEKFDWRRGFKFSTYATWWIRQAITRALADQSRTIRIPVHMVETLQRVLKTQRDMAQKAGREPSFEELAKEVGMPPERVAEILRMTLDPVSLETPVGEEDDSRLGDFIEDEAVDQPLQVACRSLMNDYLADVLQELSERERQVIQLRYGLMDGHPRTLEEVGKEFGVTRERIRQIETRTLAKLRHPTKVQKLEDLIE